MKSSFLRIMLLLTIALLAGETKSVADVINKESNPERNEVIKQEALINTQEEKIKQLEAQIKEQQKEIEELRKQIPLQRKQHPVEKALKDSWNCCRNRNIEVKNNLVRIYFSNISDIIFFFDRNPIQSAHDDLSVFLKTTGFETGTIEYYSLPEKKLFSISGSLFEAKTEQFF